MGPFRPRLGVESDRDRFLFPQLFFHFSAPWVGDRSLIPLFDGHDIEMEGCEIFQERIGCFKISVIDRLDIVMTFIAEIDTVGLFSLTIKILQRSRLLVAAHRAGDPVDPPFIAANGAKGITLPHLPFQQIQGWQRTADGAVD
jgi:hypothetical protein